MFLFSFSIDLGSVCLPFPVESLHLSAIGSLVRRARSLLGLLGMGKSIRSKIKKRLRTVKRQRVDAMIITPREEEKHERLIQTAQGRSVTRLRPKNAFKYPESEDAVFPQHEIMKPVDFRAQNLPMAGTVFRGNRRKYSEDEKAMLNKIIKENHPKMEVLAGGGAVLAKSGQKVSKEEAELIATKVNRPETVIENIKSKEVEDSEMKEAPAEEVTVAIEPEDAADVSRRPIVKDTRRAKRTAERRPRPNSVKKAKNPQAPKAKAAKGAKAADA